MSASSQDFNFFSMRYITQTFIETHGRLSRQAFFTALLLLLACTGVSLMLFSFLGLFFMASGFPLLSDLCFFVILFFSAYGFGAISVKRLRDLNVNPWWGLGGLVPLIGTIPAFILLFMIPGTDGDNRYGRGF